MSYQYSDISLDGACSYNDAAWVWIKIAYDFPKWVWSRNISSYSSAFTWYLPNIQYGPKVFLVMYSSEPWTRTHQWFQRICYGTFSLRRPDDRPSVGPRSWLSSCPELHVSTLAAGCTQSCCSWSPKTLLSSAPPIRTWASSTTRSSRRPWKNRHTWEVGVEMLGTPRLLAVEVRLPVVPRKAVAEVSKIGNL